MKLHRFIRFHPISSTFHHFLRQSCVCRTRSRLATKVVADFKGHQRHQCKVKNSSENEDYRLKQIEPLSDCFLLLF